MYRAVTYRFTLCSLDFATTSAIISFLVLLRVAYTVDSGVRCASGRCVTSVSSSCDAVCFFVKNPPKCDAVLSTKNGGQEREEEKGDRELKDRAM